MALAIFLALPLGVFLAKKHRLSKVILSFTSVTQTVPSLAAMAFLIPIFGIGILPTLFILVFYAIYPILKNTVVGVRGVPRETLEAAKAMGLNTWQQLSMVELPLAMPTIVAGVRIAMAMTIGIATIAAFIGAGGLGDFITQGLALNNMKLVLLGAIPAALLALVCDFVVSLWERALLRRMRRRLGMSVIVLIGSASTIFASLNIAQGFATKRDTIVVASKNFTEQYILAEIIAQLIEDSTELRVIRKINLGTTDTVHQAMLLGDVDIYPEYTGTAYVTVLNEEASRASQEIFDIVKRGYAQRFDLIWLKPFGFSNAQTLAVAKSIAERHRLSTLSDLATIAPQLSLGAPAEFIARKDAFFHFRSTYGLAFKSIKQMDPNLMYNAIAHNQVDVMVAFATDGRLKNMDIVVLHDDKGASLPYHAAPIVRGETLRKYPYLEHVLKKLAETISDKAMSAMNAAVVLDGKTPAEVARLFLKSFGDK